MQYTRGKQPLISVIVPVYNTASLLPRCIECILNQTHKNIELILVNDGSTDGSGDVCGEYAKKDARVRVIHQKNAGESGARNTGLDAARGEWIATVDSDDYIDLEMYEKLLSAALLNDTPLSACGYIKKRKNGYGKERVFPNIPPKITVVEYMEWGIKRINLWVGLFLHTTMLCHSKIINAPMNRLGEPHEVGEALPLRYDTAVHRGADVLFTVETLLRAGEFAYISETLYTYDCTREDNTINSGFSEKNITWFIAQKKIIELVETVSPKCVQLERRILARVAFSYMTRMLLSEHAHLNALYPECRKEAKGYMKYLLTDKETKIQSKIMGCAVYLFPRFSRVAYKFFSSLKRKIRQS